MNSKLDRIDEFFNGSFAVDANEYCIVLTDPDGTSLTILPCAESGLNEGIAYLEYLFDETTPSDLLVSTLDKIMAIVHETEELSENPMDWQAALKCNDSMNKVADVCLKAQKRIKAIMRSSNGQ